MKIDKRKVYLLMYFVYLLVSMVEQIAGLVGAAL